MVRLTRIYTRGGDQGQTSLGNGHRVDKDHIRIATFGDVDELNSTLGVVYAVLDEHDALKNIVLRVQNDLFDVGADLCVPEAGQTETEKQARLAVIPSQVSWLEQQIDRLNASLPELSSFVLPSGTLAGAHLHVARTQARRAERTVAALMKREPVNPLVLQYLNRLSDLLFVLARSINARTKDEILWVPGGER